MLDLNILRKTPEILRENLKKRLAKIDVDELIELDKRVRQKKAELDELLSKRNSLSKEIGKRKAKKEAADDLIESVNQILKQLEAVEDEYKKLHKDFMDRWLLVPNILDDDVPSGADENDNVEIRRWGEPPQFSFKPKEHFEIAEKLGILDFERASKLSGSRFAVYKGDGAKLERALINFMLDLHTQKHRYKEIIPPYIVNYDVMVGTGQFPKFIEEAYETSGQYLIPTAEVPLVNLHREEMLSEDELPIKYVAYTACFRKEAGSYGKDVKGIIRQHQFNKVELVQFTKPEESDKALEVLTKDAEEVLRLLGLPYRVVVLCSGDIGFSAAKTYDIEVWLPGQNRYREISSCSNTRDFQARRASIKFKDKNKKKQFVHTLNGSGVAVGRCLVAILENYQQKDGSVKIPEALVPYFGKEKIG
ncbi:serine--tRNA ligase [Hippea maritima]|uniref:Serine--tRNA ligase n=1 Tax=Hippea maritima (strain ATCC 700847 / DSM 10411 / MH2) TaxID=760142 RepID=F2LWH7_HIPMA|nr:serine--tRNA ligase [Hippea maritima]AEA34086.1 Seryl-tRNA synthetase [Hippea maritima DSM 10411]